MRYEDKIHFKELYNFDNKILDQFTLPEERREKERFELEKKEKNKQQSQTPRSKTGAVTYNKINENIEDDMENLEMMENLKTDENEEEEVIILLRFLNSFFVTEILPFYLLLPSLTFFLT